MSNESNRPCRSRRSVDLIIDEDSTHGFIATSNEEWRTVCFCSLDGAENTVKILELGEMITEREAAILRSNIPTSGLPQSLDQVSDAIKKQVIAMNEGMVEAALEANLSVSKLSLANRPRPNHLSEAFQ